MNILKNFLFIKLEIFNKESCFIVKTNLLDKALFLIKNHFKYRFKMFCISGVGYPNNTYRFQVVYELLSSRFNSLTRVKRLSLLNIKRSNNKDLFAFVANHLIYYPTPISLRYAWSFGFLAGMCLLTQMISGIFLALHYAPHVDLAFSSLEYIIRDVSNEWFFEYVCVTGASMFFIMVYSYIFKGLYYEFYMKPREVLFCSGLIVSVFFLVSFCNQSITSIFLIFWTIFQFSLLFFYGLMFSSLVRQVMNLYSIMYPTWIVTKHRFRITLLLIVVFILFINTFQKGSLTCCEWEQWEPYEAKNDNIKLLSLLNLDPDLDPDCSRKFLIGDSNLALKELNAIDRFLSESNANNNIKVLETFYLMKDQNEIDKDTGMYKYYQVVKTIKTRAHDGNVETVRHVLVDQNCHALPAVSEKLMPHGCVIGYNSTSNNLINIIHKPGYSYYDVPIVNDKNSFEQLFRQYLDFLLTCRSNDVLEDYNLLPKADGGKKQSTLEYGLVFLDSTNEDTPYRLTCWLSPDDSEWTTEVLPETAHLGAPLINCTGIGSSVNPVLSKFGILSSQSGTWENFDGVNFGSLLTGRKPEVTIPALTFF